MNSPQGTNTKILPSAEELIILLPGDNKAYFLMITGSFIASKQKADIWRNDYD